MTVEAQKETLEFQAEVSQVLNLVIRSLYSNKEIFLRELISNASDAAEKLRFEALSDDGLYEDDADLRIRISVDEEAGTVTIDDNGIGMSRQEVGETIGTIASSGTKKFLEKMTGDQSQDSQLIGQFGVGFYSAFIVADKVTLITRRAGLGPEHGVKWVSTGEGSYTVENVDSPKRGTRITLHLGEEDKEFLQSYRLRSIISKFSDHVAMPIEMLEEIPPAMDEEGEEKKEEKTPEWEKVNKGTALWMRNKSEISAEEYNEFYKSVGHDFEDPLLHVHNRVEGKNEYSSLLFVPSRAPFDMWDREQKHGVKLYVRRVFIMDEADKLMPHYLRFVKGVVDSDDLPLNVSREILQHDKKIDSIRSANVKRILDALEKLANKDEEKYQTFWKEFGRVLKEGPAEDIANKDKIGGLLRFATTKSEGNEETVSLDQYIENMAEKQEKIYYITGDTLASAKNSPHLEIFKKKDIEVLLLTDRVDEWLVSHLTDYKDKHLQSIAKGQLDLGELEDKEEKEQLEKVAEENKSLIERITESLGDAVKEVRVSSRLTESPACLVVGDYDMSQNMARVLKQIGQDAPMPTPIMEINVEHPLLARMDSEADEDRFKDMAKLVFDQALLAEGGQLEDPAGFVHNMNKLMLDMAG
ncbi:MAG: molecular chaperone HtpG [Gammaproteobacteria bacterium]|nr:molecular chaperone HtpG [Gammaproteobacteria bacterium]NNJ91406.1 molecular chaperone HtpG [Gammaproteobacteria bacterium]